MKRILSFISFIVLAVSAFSQTAQNTLTSTTLAGAVSTTSAQQVVLASATGISAPATNPTVLYIDTEAMFVNSINGVVANVSRGYAGTIASAHKSGAMVLAGRPNWFTNFNPSGSCTNANVIATPYINILTGDQWLCSTVTLTWVPGFGNYARDKVVTTAVASVAGTTTPSGPLFHVTGTNAITAWGIPVGCNATTGSGCSFTIIPDAAFTTTATNNIATAVTAVINLAMTWTWDATNSKFVVIQSK